MAIFGYGRVSTAQQDTENQRLELEQAGWMFDFWFADIVSGKVQAIQRKAFAEMLGKIRTGETLVWQNSTVWGVMLLTCSRQSDCYLIAASR